MFSWRGTIRAVRRGLLALVLLLAAYVALVQLDVVRSPLDPSLGGEIDLARSERPGLRVLFVGNSFTYENGMPSLLRDLARGDAGAPPLFAVAYTAPAWNLKSASRDDGLRRLLREVSWDVVVLQEASRIPALPPLERQQEMHPYARRLVEEIRTAGAEPLLFMTWGYRDGDDRTAETDSYAAMQARVVEGYRAEAAALGVPVVPVGIAWEQAVNERPAIPLWARDGQHPSRLGSYLAASSFYVALTGRSPSRSAFTPELAADEAAFVRAVAEEMVEPLVVR